MAANYGVNLTISAEASRPISVESTTPIGIAGMGTNLEVGLHFYGSVTKLKDELKEKESIGSITRAVQAIYDQAVETPIILSVFSQDSDESIEINNCKAAIEALTKSKSLFGYRPNIIIAPEYSDEDVIGGTLQTVATKLKATAIVDLNASDESEAILKAKNFGTKRLILTDPYVKVWDDETADYVFAPQSARIAGMIAYIDGDSSYGYSNSYSNRVMQGIYGTSRPIEFELGETCEADRLRTAKISTIINEEGYRAWGGETTDQDTIWTDLARVRIFDRIGEAFQKGIFFAIDKKADQLLYAKRSVEELIRNLIGADVLLGGEVTWNKEKNTKATVTAGKFYLDIRTQNNPIVKTIEIDLIYVDSYADVLMSSIS
ncbi:MAG: phage tail sheath family protein [Campylobacteraceae bacterium]